MLDGQPVLYAAMTRRYVGLLWLLSGVPVGLALLAMPPAGRLWCFAMFVVLETAHSFSPIVLAWTHRGFRQTVIWSNPWKYIGTPSAVFVACLGIGIETSAGFTSYVPGPGQFSRITDLTNPFPLLVWAYSAWNLYHFAMQDFGVLILCTGRVWRHVKRLGCLVGLIGAYFAVSGVNILGFWHLPALIDAWWVGWVMIGVVSVNHWAVDLGLSVQVAKRWWVFLLGVFALGLMGFVWMIPSYNGNMIRMIPWIICARLGLGFVHFLYSRWVWQLSNPQVRAAIGRDVFGPPQLRLVA